MHIIKTVFIQGLLLMWLCCTLTLGLLLKFNDTWEFECQANVNFGFKFFIHVFQIYFSLDVPNRTDLAGIFFFFFYLCTFNKQSIRIIQSSQYLTRVVLLTSPTPHCVVKLEDYGCQSVLYARLPDSWFSYTKHSTSSHNRFKWAMKELKLQSIKSHFGYPYMAYP